MPEKLKAFPAAVLTLMLFVCELQTSKKCEYEFKSSRTFKNGSFHSPGWPDYYPNKMRCFYKFYALLNERVEVTFTSFKIQGIRPRNCESDYLDIYSDLQQDPDSLIDSSLTGRFCGDLLANFRTPFISTHSILYMYFYSDDIKADKGFSGVFRFIDAAPYNIGMRDSSKPCHYSISGLDYPKGYIIPPTFPGVYPDNIHCEYKLWGQSGQRIRLKFITFDLFYGGSYCPFDSLFIYDGESDKSPLIDVFCGQYRGLTIYSTKEFMFIKFITRKGRIDFSKTILENVGDFSFSRRGFNITFEFRKDFVKLSKYTLKQAYGEHIIGSECDMRIRSLGQKNGTIQSPYYPSYFPVNIICNYVIDGMTDDLHNEKVEIAFRDFKIPGSTPKCLQGYVTVSNFGDNGEKFCGTLLPPNLLSNNPRLVLTFNSTNSRRGQGFLAKYIFRTDYAIPGIQAEQDRCIFTYKSNKTSYSGFLNSPWHPRSYPTDVDCEYLLNARTNELIHLSFEIFHLSNQTAKCLENDYIEIYEYNRSRHEVMIGRYCANSIPAPYVSSSGVTQLKIYFHSNAKHTAMGFVVFYQFLKTNHLSKECVRVIKSDGSGGLITTPNYNHKYLPNSYCSWTVQASNPTNKILLNFVKFSLEGKPPNCGKAVVRVSDGGHLKQLICGLQFNLTFQSIGDHINISFISSHSSLGADGFMLSWTELYNSRENECRGFQCRDSKHCINTTLQCNSVYNCGVGDTSDEEDKCPTEARSNFLLIIIVTCVSVFVVIVICSCIYCRRRRKCRRSYRKQNMLKDSVEVRYVSPTTVSNANDHLLTIEQPLCQKVSIV